MPDQKYNIDIGTTKSGDGAEKTKVTIDQLRESMAEAKVAAEQLTAAENAAVAKDGKTDGNRDLRKLAQQARVQYQALEAQVTEFYDANGQGLDAVRAGYDEHIQQLAEVKAAQDAVTEAAQAEVMAQNELREARAEAAKSARKSLKPGDGIKINQIDDSATGSGRVARLKRARTSAGNLAKAGLRLGTVFSLVWKGFEIGGKKLESTGASMQDFARDMRDADTAGAGLVAVLGKGATKVGNFLNFYSRYKDSVRQLAQAKRELVKTEKNVAASLAKRLRQMDEAIERHNHAIAAHKQYEQSLHSRIDAEKAFRLEIQKGNNEITTRLKLLGTETEGKLLDVDIQAEKDLDKIDQDDPQAAQKRFEIEKRREQQKEEIRRDDFQQKKDAEEQRIQLLEDERRNAKRTATELSNLTKEDTTNTEIISDSALEQLENAANDKTDEGGRAISKKKIAEIERQITIQKNIRAKIFQQGGFESGDSIIAAIKNAENLASQKEVEISNAQTDLTVRDRQEGNRRKRQSAETVNSQRDFTRDDSRAQKNRLADRSVDLGKDIASEASRLAQNAKFDGGKVINEGFTKIAKAFADGVLSEGEKLDVAPFLSQIQQSNAQQLGIMKALMEENKKNAQELQQLQQNLKNNL